MVAMTKREKKMMRALRIYDECVDELSFYVGHTRSRVGVEAGNRAVEVCEKAMKAKYILDRMESETP